MKVILLEMITSKTDFISRKPLRSFSTGFPKPQIPTHWWSNS